MSLDNVEVVSQAIAALNDLDVDRYLSLCAPDVELASPVASLEGVSAGPDGVRQFFAGIEESSTHFQIEVDRLQAVGADRVLLFGEMSMVSEGGVPLRQPITNVYQLVGGRLRRVDVYLDRDEALEAAGLRGL